jgi:hypothetical protein
MMKHFTINTDNNITLHASRKEAQAQVTELAFSTEEQFADAIGNDNKRLIEIWNGLPGVTPVKKFTNRKIATERIWRAIQNLGGPVAAAPAEVPPKNDATQAAPAIEAPAPQTTNEPAVNESEAAPGEPETQQDVAMPETEPEVVASVGAQAADVAPAEAEASNKANRAEKTPTTERKAQEPRTGSKTDQAIAMMKRPGGATLKELMDAFGWQAHTVRGFVAGALTKKLGLTVVSTKPTGGERTYSIAS